MYLPLKGTLESQTGTLILSIDLEALLQDPQTFSRTAAEGLARLP